MQKIVKQFVGKSGNYYSPWHDIPYKVNGNLFNFVCEIPKLTKEKIEMDKNIEYNHLVHEVKNGKFRYYNKFIYWNYGFIPQTWESPNHTLNDELSLDSTNKIFDKFGDSDPIDLIEIGDKKIETGEVMTVKTLGCLALVDEDEVDWKVVGINSRDPNFHNYNDIADVPDYILSGIREWFRWYKYPDNLTLNTYGYDDRYLNKHFTDNIVEITHKDWKNKFSSLHSRNKSSVIELPA